MIFLFGWKKRPSIHPQSARERKSLEKSRICNFLLEGGSKAARIKSFQGQLKSVHKKQRTYIFFSFNMRVQRSVLPRCVSQESFSSQKKVGSLTCTGMNFKLRSSASFSRLGFRLGNRKVLLGRSSILAEEGLTVVVLI